MRHLILLSIFSTLSYHTYELLCSQESQFYFFLKDTIAFAMTPFNIFCYFSVNCLSRNCVIFLNSEVLTVYQGTSHFYVVDTFLFVTFCLFIVVFLMTYCMFYFFFSQFLSFLDCTKTNNTVKANCGVNNTNINKS